MKNIDIKKLLFYIITTILIGSLPSIFTINGMKNYKSLVRPPLSPPAFVFPVAWTILYILMGISIYIVLNSKSDKKEEGKLIYYIQLVINALWSIIFFSFKEYFLAFTWLLMLIVFVILMLFIFYKINKKSAYINIPYLLWLFFAAYLNFGIFVLN
jgi:tryptophan-rich sensory protein